MLKKLILHFWSLRREFAKYFIIGIVGVVLDVGSLYLFKEYARLSPTLSVIVNQLFLINYSFFLNKYWAFKSTGLTHRQMVRFYFLAGVNYLISIVWIWFFTEYWPLQNLVHFSGHYLYLAVRVVNIALAVVWNFLLYKHWVYKNEVLDGVYN